MSRVPRIRFKGFEEDWEQRKHGEVFIYLRNNALSREELNDEDGFAQSIHYGDVLIKYGECLNVSNELLPYIDNKNIVNKFKKFYIQNGDVIIADTAEDETVGKCIEISGIVDHNIISGLHTIPLRPVNKFAYGYLGFYLNSNIYHNQLKPLMQGIKVTSISKNLLKTTTLNYPSNIQEQKIIGRYFDALNHLITLHQRKLEKLKTIKKSMLENFFPQNGEKTPKIRFSGFIEDWEQRKLGELADIIGGGTPSTLNLEYWDGNIDWYSPAEIIDQIYVDRSQRKITELGFENSSAKMLPEGTVLFTSRAGIGKTAILAKKGCTNQGFQSIVPYSNKLDSYFIFSRTEELKKYGELVGAGSTFAEVSGRQMGNMQLMIPKTIGEQHIIGVLFSTFDRLITLHQSKLEKLQKIKKSMLESMFV